MLAAEKFIADRRDTGGSISENLLKINVYFKSKMTKMIEETETYQTVFVTRSMSCFYYSVSRSMGQTS